MHDTQHAPSEGRTPKASPGRNRYRYRQQFGIVVICDTERAQEAAYRRLQRAGFKKLKVVTI